MTFEFDREKSRVNARKHGIDFEKAQKLWTSPSVEFAARSDYENRFAIIGPIEKRLYTCIYTFRGETIRIISCRRSRERERRLYEESFKKA